MATCSWLASSITYTTELDKLYVSHKLDQFTFIIIIYMHAGYVNAQIKIELRRPRP